MFWPALQKRVPFWRGKGTKIPFKRHKNVLWNLLHASYGYSVLKCSWCVPKQRFLHVSTRCPWSNHLFLWKLLSTVAAEVWIAPKKSKYFPLSLRHGCPWLLWVNLFRRAELALFLQISTLPISPISLHFQSAYGN